ncbi:MAG TPA: metal-dependent hydrolase [Methanoregulaceae archaeon]|nr:metal-dependent hydrolase [Methanoregulaceae archaeon]
MQLTWLGHSCVLITGSSRVLVDPFIGDGVPVREVPDIVAVTHGHADHVGETLHLAKKTVAINEIAKYLKKQGIPAEGMNIGGTIDVDGVRFTMTPAVHSAWLEPAAPGYCGGAAAGYVITMDGKRIYHAGDTALFSDMKLIGQLYKPDVACLPIGGRFTMGPDEAMMAAQFVGAPLVIPIHYNTWPAIAVDPSSFRRAIERTTDIKVAVLSPGESVEM